MTTQNITLPNTYATNKAGETAVFNTDHNPTRVITENLSRSITWVGSKQSYYTARLLVDKELVDDFYRAYAYFRWADDIVDAPTSDGDSPQSDDRRIAFVKRQKELVDRLYQCERPNELTQEEQILADLVSHDQEVNSGLQSFVRNMMSIIEFDAKRKGELISRHDLDWYTGQVAKSVTDGIQYFVGHGHPYPDGDGRYAAARGAHIVHLLRDTRADIADGFFNIPAEYLQANGIGPEDVGSPSYQAWVRERVEQARQYFKEGKRYLDKLDVLRCKIAGYWYAARFEYVLDMIEQDDYQLRLEYDAGKNLFTWIKIAWLGVTVTLRHFTNRRRLLELTGKSKQDRKRVKSAK